MENYVLYDELGRGKYSVVFKGRKKGSLEYVAVHCAEKVKRKELQNIVRITHDVSHDNIVAFYEWYETTNHIWMITELCTGQCLSVMLEQDGCFPEEVIKNFGIDIANGLHYLHVMGILYCDLQCSKLIMDGCGKVKLSNFSLARVCEEEHVDFFIDGELNDENRRPSPLYMAPEVLQSSVHAVSSDLWSFGCVLYELFTGCLPFEAATFSELVNKIICEDFPNPRQVINDVELDPTNHFSNLLQSLLCKDVGSRMMWKDLFNHHFWDGSLRKLLVDENVDLIEDEQLTINNLSFEFKDKEAVVNDEKEQVYDILHDLKPLAQKSNSESKNNELAVVSRPETAPEKSNSNLGLGTYKIDQLRPHTAQAQKLNKAVHTDRILKHSKRQHCEKESLNAEKTRRNIFSQNSEMQLGTIPLFQNLEDGDVSIESLLYHPSDFVLTSIADNSKIKKTVIPKWDAKIMGITPLTVEKLLEVEDSIRMQFLDEILKVLEQPTRSTGHTVGQRAKLHCASYLASIVKNVDVANLFANSDLAFRIVHVIKISPSTDLKGRLGMTLGLLASNATMIPDAFKMSELFMVLSETMRDNFRNVKLKQCLLPCIGEFLFYAATQEENDGKMNEKWEVPGITFTIISKCLREGEDSIVQHFAAKTIENVVTTDTQHTEKFATVDTAQMLWKLFTHCSGDSQKLTAISALGRLTLHSVILFQHIIENVGLRTVLNGLYSGSSKVQQVIITMLATLVLKGAHIKRIIEDKEFVLKVMHFLESSSMVIRGKAFLAVAAMTREDSSSSHQQKPLSRASSREHRTESQTISRENHVALLHCCRAKLVTYIERDTKRQTPGKADEDSVEYLKHCLSLCIRSACRCVPKVIVNLVNAMEATSGRKHPSATLSKELKFCIPLLYIALYLVTSNVFRDKVVNDIFIQHMGQLLAHVSAINWNAPIYALTSTTQQAPGDSLMNVVLSIVEAIVQHPSILLRFRDTFVSYVMPNLAVLSSSEAGDVRMLCLKMFADMTAMFLDSQTLVDDSGKRTATKLAKLISSELLPKYESILLDHDPLPSYALKLLLAFLEHSPTFSEVVIDKGIVSILGEILERHDGDVSGSTVQTVVSLLDCLVSSTDDLWPLYEQGLVDHVTTMFVSSTDFIQRQEPERNFSEVMLPLLDVVHGMMKYSSKVVRDAFQANSTAIGCTLTEKAEMILLKGKPLAELTGVLVQFLCDSDKDIQEWSLRCLYQVVELFGGTDSEALSTESIRCFTEALLASDPKKQKQILRIVKRLVSSSTLHASAFNEHGGILFKAMREISEVENVSEDVRTLVMDISAASGMG